MKIFSNNSRTQLVNPITDSETEILVIDSSRFPAIGAGEDQTITLQHENDIEIVLCTGRTGNTWEVIRAQQGTTALEFPAGTFVDARPTAGDTSLFIQKNSDEGAAIVPAGDEASRPDAAPATGAWLRYNNEFGTWEGSPDGVNWTGLGGAVGGAGNPAFYENDNVISADYEITTGRNAMSAGPITINDGVTVTIPDGSTWVVV